MGNFSVGEEVVCVETHPWRCVVKGEEHVIEGMRVCACGREQVLVLSGRVPAHTVSTRCTACGCVSIGVNWYNAQRFRRKALEYNSATEELLEKFPIEEEVLDGEEKKKVKEKEKSKP